MVELRFWRVDGGWGFFKRFNCEWIIEDIESKFDTIRRNSLFQWTINDQEEQQEDINGKFWFIRFLLFLTNILRYFNLAFSINSLNN